MPGAYPHPGPLRSRRRFGGIPCQCGFSVAAEETYANAAFAPALFEAGTSLAPWRARGIPGYGVYPYVLENDQLIGMHGNDERIYVEALRQGSDYMYKVFARFRS